MSMKQVFLALALVTVSVWPLRVPRHRSSVAAVTSDSARPDLVVPSASGHPSPEQPSSEHPSSPTSHPIPWLCPAQSTPHLFTGPAGWAMGPAITVLATTGAAMAGAGGKVSVFGGDIGRNCWPIPYPCKLLDRRCIHVAPDVPARNCAVRSPDLGKSVHSAGLGNSARPWRTRRATRTPRS